MKIFFLLYIWASHPFVLSNCLNEFIFIAMKEKKEKKREQADKQLVDDSFHGPEYILIQLEREWEGDCVLD